MPEQRERPELMEIRFEERCVSPCSEAAVPDGAGYSAGGARGDMREKSGPEARTMSCGRGKDATGLSSKTLDAVPPAFKSQWQRRPWPPGLMSVNDLCDARR